MLISDVNVSFFVKEEVSLFSLLLLLFFRIAIELAYIQLHTNKNENEMRIL